MAQGFFPETLPTYDTLGREGARRTYTRSTRPSAAATYELWHRLIEMSREPPFPHSGAREARRLATCLFHHEQHSIDRHFLYF
jgi:hypothetical protein